MANVEALAELGSAVAVALGAHPGHDALPWVLSLVFTLLGAGLFAWTRFRHPRVPQESIIGIIYVVSAAAATLVLSHTAEGDEALKNLLVGNVLLVTKAEVLRTFAMFVAIAIVHVLLRRKFMMLSFDEEAARLTDLLSRLVNPALMLIMGVLIGGIIVLMYLPIFQLVEQVQ